MAMLKSNHLKRSTHLALSVSALIFSAACGNSSGGQRPNPGTPPAGSAGSSVPSQGGVGAGAGTGASNGTKPSSGETKPLRTPEQVGRVRTTFTSCTQPAGEAEKCERVTIDEAGNRTSSPLSDTDRRNDEASGRTGETDLSSADRSRARTATQFRQASVNGAGQYGVGQTAVFGQTTGDTFDQVYRIRSEQIAAQQQPTYLEYDSRSSMAPEVPLFFSGSADDALRLEMANKFNIELVTQSANAGADGKKLTDDSRQLARSIQDVRLSFDREGGVVNEVTLVAVVKVKDGAQKSVQMKGRLARSKDAASGDSSALTASLQKATRFDLKSATANFKELTAQVYCVDLTPGCTNSVVRFSLDKAFAYTIVRSSPVDLFFKAQALRENSNSGFRTMVSALSNTSNQTGQYPRINRVTMTSSETISGPTQVRTLVVMDVIGPQSKVMEEAIEISGPLVKPQANDRTFITMTSRRASEVEVQSLPEVQENGISNLTVHQVSGSSLIRNNGLGSIGLQLEFKREARADQVQAVEVLELHMRRAVLRTLNPVVLD